MEWYRTAKVPRVLGHEVAGEVAAVGAGLSKIRVGERIAASHHVPCFQCHYCRLGHETLCDTLRTTHFDPGGFSERIRIPELNVRHGIYKLPANVSYEEATLIEPLACVVRAQEKARARQGQTVLVIGSGPTGLLHILLARCRGVSRIFASDLVPYRLEAAKRFGADEVFPAPELTPQRISERNDGRLADIVIVCSGAQPATQQALENVGRGGTILFFAPQGPDQVVPFPMNELFWQKGVTAMSSYAASPEDHRTSLELIATGKVPVRPLITHRLGLSEVARGFQLVAEAGESLKVVLDPSR